MAVEVGKVCGRDGMETAVSTPPPGQFSLAMGRTAVTFIKEQKARRSGLQC
ncbi:MAG: hypothetical protein M5U34_10730 [Chloroflexi bacterium]|nr:hypothetical protein [Chloroflexota bacterium]